MSSLPTRPAVGPPARRSGQAAVEFAILYAGVVLPLTFIVIYVAQMFWVWHSVVDFTRDGARWAATHCWQDGGANVQTYMQTHVPRMVDMDQFQSGSAGITVTYYTINVETGTPEEFSGCDEGDCSVNCTPDLVEVSISNYEFTRFSGFFKLPSITIPTFRTMVPMESGGFDESASSLS